MIADNNNCDIKPRFVNTIIIFLIIVIIIIIKYNNTINVNELDK